MNEKRRALAVGAHPDDVEFGMAGTLALLRDAGYEPHIMTLANGSCGTAQYDEETIIKMRAKESAEAAAVIGATYHPGLVKDLEVYYKSDVLRMACARVREVNPHIMLVPSYDDYMEDHSEAARVMVMAAFCKGMRNFQTIPPRPPVPGDTFIYHAQPHGLRDRMNRYHPPETYVRIDSVIDLKEEMLRCHRSQKDWLDVSQGMDAYLTTMRELCAEVARWTGRRGWKYAEGFQRHCHLGFSTEEKDPLREILSKYVCAHPDYGKLLRKPRKRSRR
jgi:LmbE family N-acetylglucosaminyl deacetylase